MKLTKETLKQIIKEELDAVLAEDTLEESPSNGLPDDEQLDAIIDDVSRYYAFFREQLQKGLHDREKIKEAIKAVFEGAMTDTNISTDTKEGVATRDRLFAKLKSIMGDMFVEGGFQGLILPELVEQISFKRPEREYADNLWRQYLGVLYGVFSDPYRAED
jgi:hypothetical protein